MDWPEALKNQIIHDLLALHKRLNLQVMAD